MAEKWWTGGRQRGVNNSNIWPEYTNWKQSGKHYKYGSNPICILCLQNWFNWLLRDLLPNPKTNSKEMHDKKGHDIHWK